MTVVLLELLYSSNVQRLRVSVVPANLDDGFSAPRATAWILPYSRVYINRSLSASLKLFDPRIIPLVLICF